MLQVECPPANGDNEYVRNHIGNYFEKLYSPEQLDALSTPVQRYKFWKVQSNMYQKTCSELGIEYMKVPPSAIDGSGFLKPEHYGPDSTHANALYGNVIIDALESRFGCKFVGWNSFG